MMNVVVFFVHALTYPDFRDTFSSGYHNTSSSFSENISGEFKTFFTALARKNRGKGNIKVEFLTCIQYARLCLAHS